jgi:hypothetical protein
MKALMWVLALLLCGCTTLRSPSDSGRGMPLTGAWRSKVHFKTGALAAIQDLEFLYVFNEGGTMTESSNYDAVPPVPPAYGVWRTTGPKQFEAKYVFFSTQPPAALEEINKGDGWLPAGHGILLERLQLAEGGNSFVSTIRYEAYDREGKPAQGGGDATGEGTRVGF